MKNVCIYILLLMAVCASSVWHVLGKLALTHGMDASVFLVYRMIFSACVLLLFGKFIAKIDFVKPRPEQVPRILFVGACTFLHSICFVYGLQMTTPFLCAVMQPSVPVLVWLLSLTIGVERASLRKAIGVVLCSIGAVGAAAASSHHASTGNDPMEGTDFETGTLLIILQCIFYACHLVFQQPLLQALPPVQVTSMMYGIAGMITGFVTLFRTILVALLPVIAPQSTITVSAPYWALSTDPTAWMALAFCVIFASAFTHGIYSWASKRVAPTTVSVFITVEPITTTIVSLAITQSGMPNLTEAIFAAIVAMGVILVLRGGGGNDHPDISHGYEPVGKADIPDMELQEFSLEQFPSPKHKRKIFPSSE